MSYFPLVEAMGLRYAQGLEALRLQMMRPRLKSSDCTNSRLEVVIR